MNGDHADRELDDEARRALDEIDDPEVPAEGNSPVPTLEAGAMNDRREESPRDPVEEAAPGEG